MSRRERLIVLAVALFCAATRFLALARSLWDWDEALFVLGLRDYDVTLHHPHPPGFPVYIAMAKLVRLFTGDDFRSLQSINVVASMLVFPAVFFFARELRLVGDRQSCLSGGRSGQAGLPVPHFGTCVIAGALFAFFPNVWFFGGGAFSDVPSIVLVLFAVTLLLRGAQDRNAYWLGTFLLALAIGIRPQNFLLGLVPGLYATVKRRRLEIAIALLIGVTVVGAAFGGAIYATGSFDEYLRTVREHGDYISRVDSWRSPERPPMWRLFDRFFLKQYQSPLLSVIASIFAVISIAGAIRERNRALLLNALTFLPFAIVAWMMLDRFSISRFSIGYQPMFAIFVADGIRRVSLWSGGLLARRRRTESPALQEATIAVALIAAFILYTLPALTPVRNEIAPSITAARVVAQHVDPKRDHLFVGHTMTTFVDLVLPNFPYTRVIDDRAMPLSAGRPAWLLAEITETQPQGFVFKREHTNLWNIARRHYFDIKLQPLTARPQFVEGWHAAEGEGHDEWRWMRGHSTTILPPGKGRTMLRMHLGVPAEVMPHDPTITVKLNGSIVDQFRTRDGYLERDYRVTAGATNILELSIDRTVTPPGDGRELGLRLRYLAWGPA